MIPRSVRARTSIVATAVVAAVLVAAVAALTYGVERTIFDRLQAQADAEVEAVTHRLAAGMRPADALQPIDDPDLVGGNVFTHVVILDEEGNPVVGSGFFAIAGVADVGISVLSDGTREVSVGCGGDRSAEGTARNEISCSSDLVIAQRAIEIDGRLLLIVAASPLAEVVHSVDAIIQVSAFGVPLILVLVAAVTWMATGRTLRPIERIRTEVEDLSSHTLDRRIPVPGTADEVARLAATMNRMLARLEAASARQREFVSDASHELRNPVASIRNALEVSLAYPTASSWPDVARSVLGETTRLQGIVEDLLLLARLDEDVPFAPGTVDVGLVARDAADRVRGVAVDIDIADGLLVTGREDELTSVMRNLPDNAARHASSAVAVAAVTHNSTVVITVDDDGPGIAPDQRQRVFQRFTRLEPSRGRASGGVGLGLAIVDRIVRRHGGSVAVDDGPTSGARFSVVLPATPKRALEAHAQDGS